MKLDQGHAGFAGPLWYAGPQQLPRIDEDSGHSSVCLVLFQDGSTIIARVEPEFDDDTNETYVWVAQRLCPNMANEYPASQPAWWAFLDDVVQCTPPDTIHDILDVLARVERVPTTFID